MKYYKVIYINILRYLFVISGYFIFHPVLAQTGPTLLFYSDNPASAQMNPSNLIGKGTYMGFPCFSALTTDISSSGFSYNDFIAKNPGKHDSLMLRKDVLNKLGNDNRLFFNFQQPILNFGWQNGQNAYNVQFGWRSFTRISFSKNLISLLLNGNEQFINQKITFDKENIESINSAELSFGCAHQVNTNFFLGGRFKTLFGIANFHTKNMNFSMFTDNESFKTNVFSDINLQSSTPGNVLKNKGAALDVGFTFKMPEKRMELNAALIDLGLIQWKNNTTSYISSTQNKIFEFKGITGVYDQSFQEIIDSLKNQVKLTSYSGQDYYTWLASKIILNASVSFFKNDLFGASFIRFSGCNFIGITYQKVIKDWIRLSFSNTAHSSVIFHPGAGIEVNLYKIKFYAITENINSLWLHKINSFSASIGLFYCIKKGSAPRDIPLIYEEE